MIQQQEEDKIIEIDGERTVGRDINADMEGFASDGVTDEHEDRKSVVFIG